VLIGTVVGRRCLDEFADQRRVPAGRKQPPLYTPGAQLGERTVAFARQTAVALFAAA
jgi:hypothetical protein